MNISVDMRYVLFFTCRYNPAWKKADNGLDIRVEHKDYRVIGTASKHDSGKHVISLGFRGAPSDWCEFNLWCFTHMSIFHQVI